MQMDAQKAIVILPQLGSSVPMAPTIIIIGDTIIPNIMETIIVNIPQII